MTLKQDFMKFELIRVQDTSTKLSLLILKPESATLAKMRWKIYWTACNLSISTHHPICPHYLKSFRHPTIFTFCSFIVDLAVPYTLKTLNPHPYLQHLDVSKGSSLDIFQGEGHCRPWAQQGQECQARTTTWKSQIREEELQHLRKKHRKTVEKTQKKRGKAQFRVLTDFTKQSSYTCHISLSDPNPTWIRSVEWTTHTG